MGHKGVRLLIETTSYSLGDDIQFTYARTSDFNIMTDKRYPFVSLDMVQASSSFAVDNSYNYVKVWACQMAFYQLDFEDSVQDEYAKILDFTDRLVDDFITKLNFYINNDTLTFGSDQIVITNINQTPFLKSTKDILSGHILTFNLQVPDNWDYCANNDC